MKLQLTLQKETHTIQLTGDLDIYNVETTRDALAALLADGQGLDLDLSGVESCDAAGVQLLLAARRSALAAAKTFSVRTSAPAVTKCGELIGLPPQSWPEHNR
jgi:anti-anti-sigma factor